VIAILDDEPQMRTAFRRLLTCSGFHVEEYEGAREFLDALESHRPDCLLLDLHMPGLNGFDVLETLHSGERPVPVIVITAHDEPGTAERSFALGATEYLRKPVQRAVLLAAIERACPTFFPRHQPN
jgi:FixJ family two-component response regulator